MANNRLYLKHTKTGKEILLAKYYPNTGWYMFHSEEEMNTWFDQFNDNSMWGDTNFALYPEINNDWKEALGFWWLRKRMRMRRWLQQLGLR
jgi:hypothetical protein